jgi:hypothetical protein
VKEMTQVVKFIIFSVFMIIAIGILGFMFSDGDSGDGYCENETQFVSDEQWEQLCD